MTNICISEALTSAPARQLHLYTTYAGHSQRHELVGNRQPEEVCKKEYEEADEAVNQNQHIELIEENAEKAVVFDWKQDYYMEYVTQVVNDYDTADILIRQLLLQYLSSEFVMNTENLEEYIKYTREANNIS